MNGAAFGTGLSCLPYGRSQEKKILRTESIPMKKIIPMANFVVKFFPRHLVC